MNQTYLKDVVDSLEAIPLLAINRLTVNVTGLDLDELHLQSGIEVVILAKLLDVSRVDGETEIGVIVLDDYGLYVAARPKIFMNKAPFWAGLATVVQIAQVDGESILQQLSNDFVYDILTDEPGHRHLFQHLKLL